MPPEQRKSIEELLEASAQKRRGEFGADPSMPNPMRARLHEEIAALTDSRAAVPRARWWSWNWPSLTVGAAAACLLLAAGGLLVVSQRRPNETPRFTKSNRLESTTVANQPRLADSSAASAPVDEEAKAASETASTSQTFTRAAASANFTQKFSQVVAGRAAQQKTSSVLDNFQVEQDGRAFRIVDEDGSTYTGRIEEQPLKENRDLLKARKAEIASAPAAAPAAALNGNIASPNNEFHFRATGYNDRLKKPLVFEGSYIVEASPVRKDLQAAAKPGTPQQSARILGTAKVEGEPPVQVDAVTVPSK